MREFLLAIGFDRSSVDKRMSGILDRNKITPVTTGGGGGRNGGYWISEKQALVIADNERRDKGFVVNLFKAAREEFPLTHQLVYNKDSMVLPHVAKKEAEMITIAEYMRKAGLKTSISELIKHGTGATKLAAAKKSKTIKVPSNKLKFLHVNAYEQELLDEYFETLTASAVASAS